MKLLLMLVLFCPLGGCGVAVENYKDPDIKGGDIPPQDAAFTTTVKPVLTKSCSGTGCHSSSVDEFLNSGAAFKASSSRTRLEGNNMPIPGSAQAKAFTAADKTILLNYLSGK